MIRAVWLGNRASAEILLDAGANIDAQDDKGNTAIMGTSHADHEANCKCNFCSQLVLRSDLFRELVSRGANVSLKIHEGSAPSTLPKSIRELIKPISSVF